MAKVVIQCQRGSMTMPARLVGPFAIHADAMRRNRWTLSHTATGFAIASDLRLEESADRIASALMDAVDWNFLTPDAINAWPPSERARIRGLVRGFKRDDELRANDKLHQEPQP